ncbi:DUF995 domain-containing protein [Allomesorhizobium alhagi]|jgi:Ni/Co efflux regulator RcnB|uniref:DUF995 domain-containing protein n=1 Tax=Mesorhizobium alhagi CCNWXJ12-2 TaxID=1107882 RepID=H0HKH3_9HYPH|nr:DUF995 domain-containing protein [Mesorhizobium alhagi]EHK58671.1 hypothetical protein MAXJ12_03143 [Mesorhizobium alhagi CCNWXJ12-2]
MSLRCVTLSVVVATMLATGAFAAAAQANTVSNISKARPLNSEEIYQLYNSRSWLWKAGAGHFSVKKRRFTAWSNEEGSPSYGVGQWFITGPGKLCFRARWQTKNGVWPKLTCFSHREMNGAIYQKREPEGEWYKFRGVPPRRGDEWAKLRHGDYVVSRLSKMRTHLAD